MIQKPHILLVILIYSLILLPVRADYQRHRINLIENGGFETGDFSGWQHGGELTQSVRPERPHAGTYSALLGNPAYANDAVPEGSAWISQTFEIPNDGTPVLSFWYRIFTYDVMWSTRYECYFDYLDVTLETPSGTLLEPLLRDGFTGTWQEGILQDLGWRNFTFDLGVYRGQTVRVRFANLNAGGGCTNEPTDLHFNTYTYLGDITIAID